MARHPDNPEEIFEAEVIESTVIDESLLRKVLKHAGRTIAQPALEAFEILIDPSTPTQVNFLIISLLT